MTTKRILAPSVSPVTLDDIKLHSVIEFDDDAPDHDVLLGEYLKTAVEVIERESGLLFVEQTWEDSFDEFPVFDLELSKAPVRDIESITYVDSSGVEQVLSKSDYMANVDARPCVIGCAYRKRWPSVRKQFGAVKVRYVCGFSADDEVDFVSVPNMVKQAIRVMTCHLYENRELVSAQNLREVPCSVQHFMALISVVGL